MIERERERDGFFEGSIEKFMVTRYAMAGRERKNCGPRLGTPAVLRAAGSPRRPITPSTVRRFLRLNGQLVPT